MNQKSFAAGSVLFFVLALAVYVFYLDILIPDLPNGSYRLAIGNLFVVPSFLLVFGQTLIGGLIIYFAATSLKGNAPIKDSAKKEYKKLIKAEYVKSVFIASVITFLFSLTYFFYPMYGPFYYIVFAVGGPSEAIFVEIAWTLIMVATCTLLTAKIHEIRKKHAFIVALLLLIFITVAAS